MRNIFTRLWVVSLLLLVTATVSAQQLTELEVGAVYRFVNRGTERALNAGDSDGTYYVNATTESTTDIKQQWYVTKVGEHYVLRNLEYAKYLKGATTNKVAWSLTDYYTETSNKFNLATSSTTWNTLETVGWVDYGFMHDDSNDYKGGKRVVSWVNEDANNSHWTVTKVEYSEEELQTILDEHPTIAEVVAKRTANFVSLFNEGACYTPKYSSLAEAQATTEYQALETELQTLATNIYNKALTTDGWAEANADDTKEDWGAEYAKKFRVQMYEPYSIAGDITSWLGINAHANNDNPTGVYMPAAGTVYVMVEGEIKDGATLRLVNGGPNWRIGNATTGGYALTTGLNVINITEETGMLYICYNVDTYNPDGANDEEKFPHKLSEYPPLKIHIEGGSINGFYNACGDFRATTDAEDMWKTITGASVDCDADWEYMETRANLSVIPVLGHRQILLFQLEDWNTDRGMKSLLPGTIVLPEKPYSRTESWDDYGMGITDANKDKYKINILMEAWDRIMYSELATMGVLSEDDVNKMNNLYPRWTSEDGVYAEIYDLTNPSVLDQKTYKEFCNGVDYSEYFNHHGVALGTESNYMYGGWDHCGYHINTFGSIVSKLPSEAGATWGPGHEIGHQHQGIFNLNGQTEVTNNMFANIAVWYMGMGTSRYNGSDGSLSSVLDAFNTENNDAYTNNIWALTHMYYRLWLYYHLAGNNTQFMPRLFELCRRDRLQNGTVISGDRSMLLFYKHACDAAGEDLTEFFRAHGYLEVMEDRLVGDYTSAVYTQTQAMVDEAIAYVKGKWSKQNLAIILINDGTLETTLQHNGTDSRALWDSSATAELGSVTDFIDGDISAVNYEATANSDGTITMTGEGGVGFLVFNEDGELISFSNKTEFELSDEAKEAIMSGNATFVAVDSENNTTAAEVDLTAMQKTILGELIAKAKLITDKIDDTYTKVGYYKAAAVTELANVLKYAEEVYAGVEATGYEAAYDLLYAEYQKVLANDDAKITLDLNKKYIINNKSYTTRNIAVNAAETDVYQVFALENSTGTSAQWSFVESATAGRYYLKNADGYYCPSVVTGGIGGNATTDQAQAGTYTLKELEHGLWAIIGTSAPLHAAGSGQNYNVVGWTYESPASQWYIISTEADEESASLSQLQAAIAKTEALLGEVLGTVTYTRGDNIVLQTTTEGNPYYIWTNAQEAGEGPIANLVDGATNNYFHTDWHAENVSSGDHYIAVDLGSGNTLPRFAFSHTTRNADTDHVKSVDVYGCDEKDGTYKYLGSVKGMPQTGSTFWQFEGMMISSHRYLRFNYHASRGYWHMAEFDIMPVTDYTPTVNDTYSGTVTVTTVQSAMEALYNGKGVAVSTSPTKVDIDEKLEALKTAYNALYAEYSATITARKNTLAELVTATQELIDKVGEVQLKQETPVKLTTTNFYCNAPYIATQNADYSADYVTKLTDGSNITYLHTRWNANSDDGDYHYLRVDMGEGVSIGKFNFTYTTASRGKKDMPLTMVVEGANEIDGDNTTADTFTEIVTLTSLPEVLNTNTVYNSVVLGSNETPYRYLRFKVTDITVEESDGNGHPFFTMAEFALSSIVDEKTTVNSTYKSVVSEELLLSSVHTTNSSAAMSTNALVTSVPMLDAQIADQQAAYDKLNEAMQKVTCDKTALVEYLVTANSLYEEFSEDDAIAPYYATSSVTLEQITALKEAIDASNAVVANDAAIQTAVDDALATLKAKAQVLEDIKADDYSGSREIIGTEITNAATLLAEVMTAAEAPETVVLQNGNATQPYYIWCNKPANDSHGIAGGLIDKNDDGTANTSTFFGTYWNDGAVEPYAHYLEIDLGCVKSIENFAFDYTTRASGYENQRPNGIKVLVSNDKDVYNQVLAVTDGLAAGANEKWELDAPFGFVGRYVRFAVSSQKGYFNMSDFNISFDAAYSLQEYYTTSGIDANLLTTLNDAVQQAVKARDCFVTEEMYNTAIANLTEAYNSLNTFKSAHISDRTELDNLAGTAETLVTEVATINDTETAITMQCTDENAPYYLYCNADGTTHTTYPNDAKGVAALLDDDATNHMHTTYEGAADDNLDHYLRLDMGENEAMMSFKFSYTGRNSGNNNDPTVMLIEGSNDLENFEFITKLTDLPTSPTPTTYSSGVLGNGKAYRYIRFMVIETNDNTKYKDHPYFVLSQFAVTACKTIEVKSEYQSINLPLSKLATANNEVVDAKAVVAENEHYLTETAYNEALDELQAAYNALNVAKDAQNIPVILTTDVNNPVLYKIKIKRSDTSVLEFDGAADATNMVAVDDDELGNEYQAWYFMQGTDANSNDDLLILPYWRAGEHNTTYRLASNSIGDGNSKVKAVDGTDDTYKQNWYITFTDDKTVADWWNIQPEGKATYFSNHGGTNNKMGFWADSAQSPGDDGSNFQFVLDETDYSKSDAYFALYNLHADCGGEKVSGEAIGCYTAGTVETYNSVYNAATEKLADADATDDDYNSARTALEDAYNALTRNMPVLGGFYKIRSAYKTADDGDTYSYDGVVYADDDNNVYWAKDYDITSARAIWYIEPIEGGYNIKNMHTGCSFTTLLWAEAATLSTTPATFTIDVLDDATGILKIVSGQPMHAQASGNKVVGYSGGLNTASAWTIEEVSVDDVVANIEHTITLAANTTGNDQATGYSTLNLGYPVTVPAGVTAYIVTNSAIVDNTIELYEYASEGATIPANFPVILRGSIEESAGRAFKFNNAAVAAVDNVDNLLGGSNYTTYESCLDENGDNVYNIYMLTRKSGIVAMRWVYENYRADKTNTGSNDDGGYVKCPANKVYLKLGGTTTQNLSTEYFFGIFSGTTDIDEVNTEENPLEGTIYDLQGRKIEEVVVPGFYIVNGKKVFINSELLK